MFLCRSRALGEVEIQTRTSSGGCELQANLCVPQLPGQGCSFHSFLTNTYKVTFMEFPSGIKIILVTHPRTRDLRESLKYIYNLYVEYVVKNPLYTSGTPISLCYRSGLLSIS
ncbi:hypothetical protein PRUPE_2G018100 [Prunus persica]|uniref:Trafficking protein particle complex subunit n=1 Tax=Prunus persica TaxID=3760 RepID=A0A251Q9H3_PRUPE|nr:hypothetical protein PRUPE_2G018100 [Prunus persica]